MKNLFVYMVIISAIAVGQAEARELKPAAKIGSYYCYRGWDGDATIDGHAILTDRPMQAERMIDEGSSGYRIAQHARFVNVQIQQTGRHPGWDVVYNDSRFYDPVDAPVHHVDGR